MQRELLLNAHLVRLGPAAIFSWFAGSFRFDRCFPGMLDRQLRYYIVARTGLPRNQTAICHLFPAF